MKKPYLEQFPNSETAKRMLSRVSPIYDDSYVAKWLFEVMGTELDEAKKRYEELRLQAFVETTTWAIEYWEERYGIETNERLDLPTRRSHVIAKRDTRVPMNPTRAEKILGDSSGREFIVTENVAPYTFRVDMLDGRNEVNYKQLRKILYNIKPSHQRFLLNALMDPVEFENENSFHFLDLGLDYLHSFYNLGRYVAFDGEESFDGNILFDQAVLKGLDFRDLLIMLTLENNNIFEGPMSIDYRLAMHNKNLFRLADLGFVYEDAFYNLGRYISFNGKKLLDGSILFNQGVSKGLDLSDLLMVFAVKNKMSLEMLPIAFRLPIFNQNHFRFADLGVTYEDAFYNLGRYISFNGKKRFNGKIRFNQKILKGLAFSDLEIASAWKNSNTLSGQSTFDYGALICNPNDVQFSDLHLDFRESFYNLGKYIAFNGRRKFNKSFRFNQRVSKGLGFPDLELASDWKNPKAYSLPSVTYNGLPIFNANNVPLADLRFEDHESFCNLGKYIQFNGKRKFNKSFQFNQRVSKRLDFSKLNVALGVENSVSFVQIPTYDDAAVQTTSCLDFENLGLLETFHNKIAKVSQYNMLLALQTESLARTFTAGLIKIGEIPFRNRNEAGPRMFAFEGGATCKRQPQGTGFQVSVGTSFKGCLTGSLKRDSMHYMDGTKEFNGAITFNSRITEEEI